MSKAAEVAAVPAMSCLVWALGVSGTGQPQSHASPWEGFSVSGAVSF